ncbi:hypothetical protein BPOR_0067g00140 [Botrytis porri]|uniref:Uncharacterized protein n=1 Tax=Botrytis porri TaxID=87229 RepID=A0A4Z1L0N1_9HELO|nr:hypothetical protein BPOR_0067g00140 [Botrytis porri]
MLAMLLVPEFTEDGELVLEMEESILLVGTEVDNDVEDEEVTPSGDSVSTVAVELDLAVTEDVDKVLMTEAVALAPGHVVDPGFEI